MADYTYTKDPVNIDRLEQEIKDLSLGASLVGSVLLGDQLTITFDASLSAGDEASLDSAVAAHSAPSIIQAPDFLCSKEGVDDPSGMSGCASIWWDALGNLRVMKDDGSKGTVQITWD